MEERGTTNVGVEGSVRGSSPRAPKIADVLTVILKPYRGSHVSVRMATSHVEARKKSSEICRGGGQINTRSREAVSPQFAPTDTTGLAVPFIVLVDGTIRVVA